MVTKLHAGKLKLWFFLNSFLLLLSAGACVQRNPQGKHSADLKSRENSKLCSVPQLSDFDAHKNDQSQQAALDTALRASGLTSDGQRLVGTASPEVLKKWILVTLTPLSMGCQNFESGGVQKYGADSYSQFVSTASGAMRGSASARGLKPVNLGSFEFLGASDNQKEFIGTLISLNREIVRNPSAKLRSSGEDVIHGSPLTPEEENMATEISAEGLINIATYNQPFLNAYGEKVSGRFLSYPNGSEVKRHILALAKRFENSKTMSDNDYQDESARIMRKCITIHPFHDGNGRTCTLFALWMQSQRNLPHSVLWSGEDVLLREEEFVRRYRLGIQFHSEFRKIIK